jgi:hypothetical protein
MGPVVAPVLDCSRTQLLDVLALQGQATNIHGIPKSTTYGGTL